MADITGEDLVGRTIRIDGSRHLEAWYCRVTFADTGEELTNIERIELDMQPGKLITATLHLAHVDKCAFPARIRRAQAETTDVELSTLALVEEVSE